jgi:hypothetical protein
MTLRLHNIEHHRVLTDGLAAAMVASLPWSTSATGILVVAWLLALLPLLRAQDVRDVMRRPAAWLPVALVLFMALGMLWAFDATWSERLRAFNASAKLLVIPLLMIQFARKDGGTAERGGVWALNAFIASCTLLLFFSAGSFLWPHFPLWSWVKMPGLPVKDYIIQSGLFVLCAFILLYLARDALQRRRYPVFALRAALAAAFLADVFFVTSGRTSLVTVPVLLLLYALVCFRWKAASVIMVSGMLVGGVVWSSSDYVRMRLGTLVHEVQDYRAAEKRSSAGVTAPARSAPCSHAPPPAPATTCRRSSPIIRTTSSSRWRCRSGFSAASSPSPCGSRICCCSAAAGLSPGSGFWWWCRISSARCSIRICSISGRGGSMPSASALPAA